MKGLALLVLVTALVGGAASAQPQSDSSSVVGDWHGTSICLVRPSACHDEEALYLFRPKAGDAAVIVGQFDKIVNGQAEEMGPPVDCSFNTDTRVLHCDFGRGYIDLTLSGDALDGAMFMRDGTRWRDVRLSRRGP